VAEARRPSSGTRRRLTTGALSVLGHLGVLAALLAAQPAPPRFAEPAPILVQLVAPPTPPAPPALTPAPDPKPTPPAKTPEPPKKPTKPPPPRHVARRTPARAHAVPIPAGDKRGPSGDSLVSDAELAGASTAGGGGGGGGECNMTRRLQAALRKDRLVQAAAAEAHQGQGLGGKAIRVWNGDWVRHGEQDGNGLAAVREAIMWEVGFAPAACRAERVHGLVLISLNDAPGAARLVVGSGDWRWSDLLRRRGPAAQE